MACGFSDLVLSKFEVFGDTGPSRPNAVLILVDDLDFEAISSYGGTSYRTPNIEALAGNSLIAIAHLYTPVRFTYDGGVRK
jgi:hypothetical protein